MIGQRLTVAWRHFYEFEGRVDKERGDIELERQRLEARLRAEEVAPRCECESA